MVGDMTSPKAVQAALVISPRRPALDTVLRIRLSGLAPRARVLVQARQADPGGCVWSSSAGFTARDDGTVDLSRDAPGDGSYGGVDPMGLIWSMEPLDEAATRGPGGVLAPSRLTVTARIDGRQVCGAEVERLRIPDGLTRTQVSEHGVVGVLYQPDGQRAVPGVLLLGGSEGGLHEDDAALLAAHGYAVLALAYYGLPGLPVTAQDIPLEYFEQALHLLQAAPHVRRGQVAVAGASMGGEAALLIGATFPLVGAVISIVGSGLVTQGISQDVLTGSLLDIMATPVPNWTRHGRPLPYLPNVVTPALRARVAAGEPIPLRMAFEPALARTELLAAATIPVERINGPVLLISGEQDQGYGPAFHHVAADRLAAHHHPHPWEHVIHPGAGHLIAAPPYAPTTRTTSPGPGVTFEHGGTPAANAAARSATWGHVLRFLTLATAGLRGCPGVDRASP
jgi:dienelactone hydrolase